MRPFRFDPQAPETTLSPGELFFGAAPAVVHTLLGSCVAITLWQPERRIGGMCHYLLARREEYHNNANHPPGYYATDAIDYFAEQASRSGLRPRDFQVKVFGGGNMFEGIYERADAVNVAGANIEHGLHLLRGRGFGVKATDVGGVRYRRVFFDLASGDVWVQYGRHSQSLQGEGGVCRPE